jgi:hypothetical protein
LIKRKKATAWSKKIIYNNGALMLIGAFFIGKLQMINRGLQKMKKTEEWKSGKVEGLPDCELQIVHYYFFYIIQSYCIFYGDPNCVFSSEFLF